MSNKAFLTVLAGLTLLALGGLYSTSILRPARNPEPIMYFSPHSSPYFPNPEYGIPIPHPPSDLQPTPLPSPSFFYRDLSPVELESSPDGIVLYPGIPSDVSVRLTPLGGFRGKVSFYAIGLPAGVRAVFHPASELLPGKNESATLVVIAGSKARFGQYSVRIAGRSSGLQGSEWPYLDLNIQPFVKKLPFQIRIPEGNIAARQGERFSVPIKIRSKTVYLGHIRLSILDDPYHPIIGKSRKPWEVKLHFTPGEIRGSGYGTLIGVVGIKTPCAPLGRDYHLLVRATASNGTWQEAPLTVSVWPSARGMHGFIIAR